MRVQVTTDSTADIPKELSDKLGIKIEPIYLRFCDVTYRDGIDIGINEFYEC